MRRDRYRIALGHGIRFLKKLAGSARSAYVLMLSGRSFLIEKYPMNKGLIIRETDPEVGAKTIMRTFNNLEGEVIVNMIKMLRVHQYNML